MSGTCWITRTASGTTAKDRRLHTDKNCQYLQNASSVRKAMNVEHDQYEVCEVCQGDTGGQEDQNWEYQRLLKEAE